MENNNIQNDTELKIQNDTEIMQNDTENPKKKWISDFYVELVLFLILGILVGIAVKTEAMKKITIGFDDYRMKIGVQDFDINKMQIDLASKQKQEEEKNNNSENNKK